MSLSRYIKVFLELIWVTLQSVYICNHQFLLLPNAKSSLVPQKLSPEISIFFTHRTVRTCHYQWSDYRNEDTNIVLRIFTTKIWYSNIHQYGRGLWCFQGGGKIPVLWHPTVMYSSSLNHPIIIVPLVSNCNFHKIVKFIFRP